MTEDALDTLICTVFLFGRMVVMVPGVTSFRLDEYHGPRFNDFLQSYQDDAELLRPGTCKYHVPRSSWQAKLAELEVF